MKTMPTSPERKTKSVRNLKVQQLNKNYLEKILIIYSEKNKKILGSEISFKKWVECFTCKMEIVTMNKSLSPLIYPRGNFFNLLELDLKQM